MISNSNYIRHMLDEIDFVLTRSMSLTVDAFLMDETLQRAFVRSLEIIGEASKKISNELKLKYSGIEWRAIAGTRDKLIFVYFF